MSQYDALDRFLQIKIGTSHKTRKYIFTGTLPADSEPYVLPSITDTLEKQTLCESDLETWSDYYKWCGLSLDNPAAELLQWPLTVYHVLVHMSPQKNSKSKQQYNNDV